MNRRLSEFSKVGSTRSRIGRGRSIWTRRCANRLSIFLPLRTSGWCLLHEIAHAMSRTEDGRSDGHESVFMGLYAPPAGPLSEVRWSVAAGLAQGRGVRVTIDATPIFLEHHPRMCCRGALPQHSFPYKRFALLP
jgi:hypothetical protein